MPAPHCSPMAFRPSRSLPLLIAALSTALGLGAPGPATAQAAADNPGAKGAQVYCFMRSNGNNHEVSWTAAYALIKRQSASLFRTSPEHAAVMITEAVVQNPGTYPDCGRFLGDLYNRRVLAGPGSGGEATTPQTAPTPAGGSTGYTRGDRYGN
jgi:hypothetical protein